MRYITEFVSYWTGTLPIEAYQSHMEFHQFWYNNAIHYPLATTFMFRDKTMNFDNEKMWKQN